MPKPTTQKEQKPEDTTPLADEDVRLGIDQEKMKAAQAAVDASRQLQDCTLQRQREQEDANDSLGYSTPERAILATQKY